jgi:hypothetical protein
MLYLSRLQTTIRSALSGYILQHTIPCALLYQLILQGSSNLPTIRSDMYGDTINDSKLCSSLSGYTMYNRLSALICMAILQTTLCCGQLCLAILQPTIQLPTIRFDLYGDTTNDYLLSSTLTRDTIADFLRDSTLSGDDTSEYPIYQLSALICMAMVQTIICCALLLCLQLIRATICGTLICLQLIRASICSTLLVDMLVCGLVWGLVGVPFRRLVGVLVVGVVGAPVGR